MDAVLRFVERGLGVAIVPAMVLIDRPGLRSVRLDGPTLDRTISVARPADVAPTAAVEVMRRTITASATAFAATSGGDHAARRRERVTGRIAAHRPSRTRENRVTVGAWAERIRRASSSMCTRRRVHRADES